MGFTISYAIPTQTLTYYQILIQQRKKTPKVTLTSELSQAKAVEIFLLET